jgi:hypothetical protein
MNTLLLRAGVLAFALSAIGAAEAQSVGSSVIFPSGWAPGQSVCVKQADGTCVPVGPGTPLPVRGGSNTLTTGQVSVGTAATLVKGATQGRAKIILSVGAANSCAIGNAGVTGTTGFPLQPVAGATLTLDTSAAIYAACSATTTVSFIEQF